MSTKHTVSVFAPATVANLGPGFDILGLAIDGLGDSLTITRSEQTGLTLQVVASDANTSISCNPHKNAATVPIIALAEAFNIQLQHAVTLFKNMPIGSGLGSSAASAAAGALAGNEMFSLNLTRQQLIEYAMLGEQVACGSAHADNVAPALLGGIALVQSYDPLLVFQIPCALNDLYVSVVHPAVIVNTEEARSILPQHYDRSIVVQQLGNVSSMVAGLILGDSTMLKAGHQDFLAQPFRCSLIPGFKECSQAALHSGALAFGISGSGPAVFALSQGSETAQQITIAVATIFDQHGLATKQLTSPINLQGATVSESQ